MISVFITHQEKLGAGGIWKFEPKIRGTKQRHWITKSSASTIFTTSKASGLPCYNVYYPSNYFSWQLMCCFFKENYPLMSTYSLIILSLLYFKLSWWISDSPTQLRKLTVKRWKIKCDFHFLVSERREYKSRADWVWYYFTTLESSNYSLSGETEILVGKAYQCWLLTS